MGPQFRYANIVLGIWLFISAFLWPHGQAPFTNTWIMGIVVAVVAVMSLSVREFRFVNTLAGIWLVVSAFAFPRLYGSAGVGTTANNVIVGVLVFTSSFAHGGVSHRRQVRPT